MNFELTKILNNVIFDTLIQARDYNSIQRSLKLFTIMAEAKIPLFFIIKNWKVKFIFSIANFFPCLSSFYFSLTLLWLRLLRNGESYVEENSLLPPSSLNELYHEISGTSCNDFVQ